jgi:hypothetical protein
MALAAPPVEAGGAEPEAEVAAGAAPAPRDLLAVGTPEVKGAAEAEEAPLNAGTPAAAEGLAMVALAGLRTLQM